MSSENNLEARMTELKDMVADCGGIEPDLKAKIEQACFAAQQGQAEIARELLRQTCEEIEA